MKTIAARTIALIAVALVFPIASYAQKAIKANIPFEFTVGKKPFPSGEYVIRQFTAETLLLTNSNNRLSTLLMGEAMLSQTEASPRLKFEVSDAGSFLSEVWVFGTDGFQLSVPKRPGVVAQNSRERVEVQATLTRAK